MSEAIWVIVLLGMTMLLAFLGWQIGGAILEWILNIVDIVQNG